MKKILGISGSPRKGGNSDIFLQHVLKGAGSISTEAVHLRDYQFQSCIGCERCRKDKECTGLMDGMQLIYPKIIESAGLVIVTPIYSYNVTVYIKALFDRMYAFYNYGDERPGPWSSRLANQGRKAVFAVIGEQSDWREGGMDLTMEVMQRNITALGYEIVTELPVPGVFRKGKIKELEETLKQAEAAGQKLASRLDALSERMRTIAAGKAA